ncbi:MAG: C4-type zinc ribbon domain-containing protein [Nocardioides sp.]
MDLPPLKTQNPEETALKAEPSAQLKLLDVQSLDAKADQLRHQQANLPEIAEIATLDASLADLVGQARDQQIVVDDLTAAQRKADVDVEHVKARRTRDRDRMEQGLITNPKDLERMQHELQSLERRITVLEDEELEVMEQLEEAQATLQTLSVELAAAEERREELAATCGQKAAAIDQALDEISRERAPTVEGVPDELIALYDRLRTSKNGVGAAELRARQCGGCRLTLDNSELSQIASAASDLVIRCEECQRILVRTSESGL